MTLLAVKVLLAPGFVVLASLAGRRFGVQVGGMLGGLPVVAGPILLVYALAHGSGFAADAATGTLLGLVSLMSFVVVYARLAALCSWQPSLVAGWLAFALATLAFTFVRLSAGVALCAMGLALLLALALLPRAAETAAVTQSPPHATAGGQSSPPRWDLPLRAGCALALVATLTTAAGWLGPQLSGLLAPFPVIGSVLSAFTHAQRGSAEAVRLLRGLLLGYAAFGLFCFVLAISLRPLGTAGGFALACGAAIVCQAAVLWRHRSRLGAPAATAAESGS